jgi:hypothetical protein
VLAHSKNLLIKFNIYVWPVVATALLSRNCGGEVAAMGTAKNCNLDRLWAEIIEKEKPLFTGTIYLAKCEENSLFGKSWFILSTTPYEDESCTVTPLGVFSGEVTGEIAKTLAENGIVVLGDE